MGVWLPGEVLCCGFERGGLLRAVLWSRLKGCMIRAVGLHMHLYVFAYMCTWLLCLKYVYTYGSSIEVVLRVLTSMKGCRRQLASRNDIEEREWVSFVRTRCPFEVHISVRTSKSGRVDCVNVSVFRENSTCRLECSSNPSYSIGTYCMR